MTTSGTEAVGPRGPADPATLRALAAARGVTRDLAEDLLTHLPDLGDITTQRALDAWVEQAADTLRAISEALAERLIDLGRTPDTARTAPVHRSPVPGQTVGQTLGQP